MSVKGIIPDSSPPASLGLHPSRKGVDCSPQSHDQVGKVGNTAFRIWQYLFIVCFSLTGLMGMEIGIRIGKWASAGR